MLRCIELAKNGLGTTAPNPSVGCVIVHNQQIIGEGYTSPYGGNHAEVNAINSVKDKSLLPKSTLYVSLEPCAHFGKTPPCADLVCSTKIKRVVIGCVDSNSKVNGAGIKKLMEGGIDVVIGKLEEECRESNKRFFTFHEKKRPYIILKWAETADGFVDHIRPSNEVPALAITCDSSNVLVHKWRTQEQAIMVGKNTVMLDNPTLTARLYAGTNPVRIIIDSKLEIDTKTSVFSDDASTIIFNTKRSEKNGNTELIRVNNTDNLKEMLTELFNRDIQSVILEGGPKLHNSFYQAGLWDEIRRFVSPTSIHTGVPALNLDIEPIGSSLIGTDELYSYSNR